MKRLLCAVSAMILLTVGVVYAEGEKPVGDQSQPKLEQPSSQGTAGGHQERADNEVKKPQGQNKKMGEKAKADEVKKKKEWAEVGAAQNRIHRHNAQVRHDRAGRHR